MTVRSKDINLITQVDGTLTIDPAAGTSLAAQILFMSIFYGFREVRAGQSTTALADFFDSLKVLGFTIRVDGTPITEAESIGLEGTLVEGNTTGGTDIEVSSGDSIVTPAGSGGSAGGALPLTTGAGDGVGDGGAFSVSAGAGGATGAGGSVDLSAGAGGATSGSGGALDLSAGDAAGTNSDGGNLLLSAGTETGSGTAGTMQFFVGGTTYTWPLADGTAGQRLTTDASGVLSWETGGGGGGTLDHAALTSNLLWSSSGHTGTASTFAAFTGAGAATNLSTTASGGDIGGTWPALTVSADAITNAKLADMAANTVKVNATAGAANPTDLAIATNTVLGRVAGNIVAGQLVTAQVTDDAITFVKVQNIATDRLLGRDTAASGSVEELTVGGGVEFTGSGGIQRSALTGDVTASAGSNATTIANDAVTNAKLANMAANTVKTRSVGSSGDPGDLAVAEQTLVGRITSGVVAALTATQATTVLNVFTSALKGLVPSSGGGTTNFLRADGTWAAPAGGGSVTTIFDAFNANNVLYPASAPGGAFSRNAIPIVTFDDAVNEQIIRSFKMSDDYADGDLTVDIDVVAASATTGNMVFAVAFEANAPGGNDIDSDSFAAQKTVTIAAPGTSGVIARGSITFTQAEADAIAAGNAGRIQVERLATDGSDNMSGDAQLIFVGGRQ